LDRRPPPAPPETAARYVNLWREPEAIGAERVTAFVAILRTRGCYWADGKGCSMCGYAKDTLGRSATPGELDRQLEGVLRAYRDEPYVKFYTSGSFLDDREVDATSREKIVRAFSGRARRLLFETLPEFVEPATVEPLRDAFAGELEIALGLESADPQILGRFVTKGSPPSAYFDAFDRARAILRYDEVSRAPILALKHADRLELVPGFAQWLERAGRDLIAGSDLIDSVDPVQLSIRLLVPPGSLLLARPEMQLDSDPLDAAIDDHMYFSKEASSGGRSFAGGGCGCN